MGADREVMDDVDDDVMPPGPPIPMLPSRLKPRAPTPTPTPPPALMLWPPGPMLPGPMPPFMPAEVPTTMEAAEPAGVWRAEGFFGARPGFVAREGEGAGLAGVTPPPMMLPPPVCITCAEDMEVAYEGPPGVPGATPPVLPAFGVTG